MLFQLFVSPRVLSVVRQRRLAWLKLTKDFYLTVNDEEEEAPPPRDVPLRLDEIMTVGRHYAETELNCHMGNMVSRLKTRRCFHICWS